MLSLQWGRDTARAGRDYQIWGSIKSAGPSLILALKLVLLRGGRNPAITPLVGKPRSKRSTWPGLLLKRRNDSHAFRS